MLSLRYSPPIDIPSLPEVTTWEFPTPSEFPSLPTERVFFIDNLLVQIQFVIVMTRWTGLAPWEFVFSFPGSLTSTFLEPYPHLPCIRP